MPITIDEVTAEVAPPERNARADGPAEQRPEPPSDARKQMERVERMTRRAARICAN